VKEHDPGLDLKGQRGIGWGHWTQSSFTLGSDFSDQSTQEGVTPTSPQDLAVLDVLSPLPITSAWKILCCGQNSSQDYCSPRWALPLFFFLIEFPPRLRADGSVVVLME